MKVPFNNLQLQHHQIANSLLPKWENLIKNSSFVLGEEVASLENELSEFLGDGFSAGVASGYDSLYITLKALGISRGDEVILPAHTFAASAFAVSNLGANPVFIDVNEKDYNINSELISNAITPRTKAIMPVHLYGQMADMKEIMEIASKHELFVVEDNAQSLGARSQDAAAGLVGHAGCTSFYPGKTLGSMGEGGAVFSRDKELIEKIKMLRNVGQFQKGDHRYIGVNSRLQPLQAIVLREKLRGLSQEIERRVKIADLYREHLQDIKEIQRPYVKENYNHTFHLYVIRLESTGDRQALRKHLEAKGIQTGVHYKRPVPLEECYASLEYSSKDFPVAWNLSQSLLSLPFYSSLQPEQIAYVAKSIKEFFAR